METIAIIFYHEGLWKFCNNSKACERMCIDLWYLQCS